MSLKEKLLSYFIAFEEHLELNTPIYPIRLESLKNFKSIGFPTKKDEEWKYSFHYLNELLKNDYNIFLQKEINVELKHVKKYFLHDIDTYKIVFVDGKYNPFLSNTTHDRADICILSSTLNQKKYQKNIKKYFNKSTDKRDGIVNMNTSFALEGAYIYIPKGVIIENPIQIIHFSTGKQNNSSLLTPRSLIILEENAHVQILERHQSLKDHEVLTNSVTEVFAHKNASLDYYKIQNDLDTSSLIDNTFIYQETRSCVSMHTFSSGGNFIRNNLNYIQAGQRIESILKGISIVQKSQHIDHHTLVHHKNPNCESYQDYKGVFFDESTGVFNGRVKVEKEAQKINAFQKNNNILFSDKATINTKPQLEIFADDVKCSHGCTIGQLNERALFYLQSRGIPEAEARAMLTFAFANDILNSVKIPNIKKRITDIIAEKLNVNIGFDF